MATSTQYNPNHDLNARLFEIGASKTVYALVTPETEAAKAVVLGEDNRTAFFSQFREAWTGKQDALHTDFFNRWHAWSAPVVDLDRTNFPFFYPTAGASEPLRHLIFDFAAHGGEVIHVFQGEYEGYKAMAEAAGLHVIEHDRAKWRDILEARGGKDSGIERFFISQPSAIDGGVWSHFNEFVAKMPDGSIVADVTYVGAVPEIAVVERFDLNAPAIRNIVFSLSKPFGLYYDRVGGVFCREEDAGLFGNKWFKSLYALAVGTAVMERYGVFFLPNRYRDLQAEMAAQVTEALGFEFQPADVFLLATAIAGGSTPMETYLRRAGRLRLCLTKGMAEAIGTA